MKLSLCITCMNRLYQLRETLPHNLKAIEFLDGVELCLVNFNSQDGLDEYIKEHFMHYIESGKLNYFYTKEPEYFHCSIAKNLAHRLGSGDILYNLDGDNFITETNVNEILGVFANRKKIFLHERRNLSKEDMHDGTYGRIALTRVNFYLLNGYDENLLGASQHDCDLIKRLKKFKIHKLLAQSDIIPAILNDKTATMANQKFKVPHCVYMWVNDFLIFWRNALRKSVNPNGMQSFLGILNFKEHTEI